MKRTMSEWRVLVCRRLADAARLWTRADELERKGYKDTAEILRRIADREIAGLEEARTSVTN